MERLRKCLIGLMVITLISMSCFALYKPSIHTATYHEILAIQGVGEHKAELIVNYLDHNPNAVMSDLQRINGIGTTIVQRLGREWH